MYVPKEIADKVSRQELESIISKYKSTDYSIQKNYEKLCEEYRKALYDKDGELAQELYKIMRDAAKKRSAKRKITSAGNRRSFWKYVKRIGYKCIFSADDVSNYLYIARDSSEELINDAVSFGLIYKDGPTTYRMRNPKKINGNNVNAFLNYGKKPENLHSNCKTSKGYQKKVEDNYKKLLIASGKSNREIQKGIDEANNSSELLAARRKSVSIARKRNKKQPNWKKDARKMQNQQPTKRYASEHGTVSFKKEYVDPDEKDKSKRRELQLGTTKRFIDFYGLDG